MSEDHITTLEAMGFPRSQAVPTLIAANNDINLTISLLVSEGNVSSASSQKERSNEKKTKYETALAYPSKDTGGIPPPEYKVHTPPKVYDFQEGLPTYVKQLYQTQYPVNNFGESSASDPSTPTYKAQQVALPQFTQRPRERSCGACFNSINYDERDMYYEGATYHLLCYSKRVTPKCAHCHDALLPDTRKHRSGQWIWLDETCGKRVHEECYRFAGPRCTHCLDVICENPEKNISGSWVFTDPPSNTRMTHLECWYKVNRHNVLVHK
eukprot:CFRG2084T1